MVVLIFFLVYFGMVLGKFRGMRLDRTAIVVVGALFLFFLGPFSKVELLKTIDWETIGMLLGLNIVSSALYFSGFYTYLSERLDKTRLSFPLFLLFFLCIIAAISALLINDIICLALTPITLEICERKKWPYTPFLLALAASANIGSAFTLMGNPQNIFLSEALDLSFSRYFFLAFIPCVLSLFWTWAVLYFRAKKSPFPVPGRKRVQELKAKFSWEMGKVILILLVMTGLFFLAPLPKYQVALGGAILLLLLCKERTVKVLQLVDWKLLLLFLGLFIINGALLKTAFAENFLTRCASVLNSPLGLYLASILLSNLFSNVPAAILLVSFAKTSFLGMLLALATTFAGNLFLIGSISNLIVAAKAEERGAIFSWKEHLKAGIPITLGSLCIAGLWLFFWQMA